MKPRITLQAGVILSAGGTGFYLQPATARRLGFKCGDYVQVDSPDHGTSIIRELVGCKHCCSGRYIYMDEESAYYLNACLSDEIVVKLAEYTLNIP